MPLPLIVVGGTALAIVALLTKRDEKDTNESSTPNVVNEPQNAEKETSNETAPSVNQSTDFGHSGGSGRGMDRAEGHAAITAVEVADAEPAPHQNEESKTNEPDD